MKDWVLVDRSEANWPGWVRWRGPTSAVGYASAEDAHARMVLLLKQCAARGFSGPDFRVRARLNGSLL